MAQTNIPVLKQKFADGKTPNGNDFSDVFDSYIHKSEKIPQTQIFGLQETIESATQGLIWKDKVTNVSDLATTYPNAQKGWAAMVTSVGYIYSYNGTEWVNTGLTAFPADVVTQEDTDQLERGLMQLMPYNVPFISGGGYLNANGTVNSTSAASPLYDVTDYISVNQGDIIYYMGSTGSTGYAIMGYNEFKNFKTEILGVNTDIKNIPFTIPEGVFYIRISGRNSSYNASIVPVSARISINPTSLRNYINYNAITETQIEFFNGYYLNSQGTLTANAQYSATDYIQVTTQSKVIVTVQNGANGYGAFGYSDNLGNNPVMLIAGGTTVYDCQLNIPDGVNYIRIGGRNYTANPAKAKRISNISDIVNQFNELQGFINKISGREVLININGYPGLDGKLNTLSTFYRSDFIPVTEEDLIIYTGASGNSSLSIAGYSDKNELSFVSALLGNNVSISNQQIIVPPGINYVIISGKNSTYSPSAAYLPKAIIKLNIISNKQLRGKLVSIMGDSISAGNNAREWTVMQLDVGNSLDGYPTYFDVGKTIGDVTITPLMVGTLVNFTNIRQEDVGKYIGQTSTGSLMENSWWRFLIRFTGMEFLQNVSMGGLSVTKNRNTSGSTYEGQYLWHPSQIRKLRKRNESGNWINPDIVIINRGTNDYSYEPFARLTDFGINSFSIPISDEVQPNIYGFKEAYCIAIQKIREAYPSVKIFICTLSLFKRINYSKYPSNNGMYTLPMYNDAIREVAKFMSCGLIELDKDGINWYNISNYKADLTHPNEAGQEIIGKKAAIDLMTQYS